MRIASSVARLLSGACLLLLLGCSATVPPENPVQNVVSAPTSAHTTAVSMQLTSSAFAQNQAIPSRYTCDGDNESPPLSIVDPPVGTKSFAMILHDPDAPVGDFLHWLIWNIPPHTKDIPAGSVPPGAVEGRNAAGKIGYTGPCPPSGVHHYHFDVTALDTTLDLPATAMRNDLLKAMDGHTLGQATLIGLYQRPGEN